MAEEHNTEMDDELVYEFICRKRFSTVAIKVEADRASDDFWITARAENGDHAVVKIPRAIMGEMVKALANFFPE